MAGRTTWFAHDVGLHRRGLWVELGDEFGAEGPNVMHVLCSRAGEQRNGGRVREGFPAIAREAFVDRPTARKVVEFAASIGLLDELQIDEDGRRFSMRVSGWTSDQEKGRAAWRKAAQRERDGDTSDRDEPSPTVTSHGTELRVTPSPLHHNTEHHSCGGDAREPIRQALAAAGYDRGSIELADSAIGLALSEHSVPVADIDWFAFGQRLREKRESGACRTDKPDGALRFMFKGLSTLPRLNASGGSDRKTSDLFDAILPVADEARFIGGSTTQAARIAERSGVPQAGRWWLEGGRDAFDRVPHDVNGFGRDQAIKRVRTHFADWFQKNGQAA